MLINATYVLSQGVHIGSSIDIESLYIELDSVCYCVHKFVHVISSIKIKDFDFFSNFSMLNSCWYYLEKKHIFPFQYLFPKYLWIMISKGSLLFIIKILLTISQEKVSSIFIYSNILLPFVKCEKRKIIWLL